MSGGFFSSAPLGNAVVRHPALFAHEMPELPAAEATHTNRQQKQFYGTEKAYQPRWDKVSAEKVMLPSELVLAIEDITKDLRPKLV